jgi:3D (Asp-Asp-Asp) domain-containing protein
MRLISMRLALLVALLLASASDIPAPTLSATGPTSVRVAYAAVERPTWTAGAVSGRAALAAAGRVDAVEAFSVSGRVVGRADGSAHVTGYAIPADHPHPPLGKFKLTAYSGPQLGQALPITATGTSARAGRTVAVDPKVIPLGSRVYIEGVGERIAEDIGGGVRGRHIDVYVPSVPQAKTFGVKRSTVSVIALPEDRG